ncbi:MAG: type II toxin-antitoxin system VapC family toxin [Thermoanaerobaculia bacterium]
MILVDTSVWVEHLRHGQPRLAAHLVAAEVAGHPFVLGEIALGHLRRREEILGLLTALPQVEPVSHEEILEFITRRNLVASGIGWVDVHLLAAAALSGSRLWTLDRRLAAVAARLELEARSAP